MGVKDLWNVLAPVAQKSTLYDLQGKTLAVDLSCWVCEGQAVGEKVAAQPRMYLRNLFFRTQLLITHNVKLIFVLDGEAPELKLDAMQQRNNIRFNNRLNDMDNHKEGKSKRKPAKASRARFRGILKTCEHMLQLMGVPCIESDGEAEALCGQLSRERVVDGVITQDSDVFLYGARIVIRNLTIKAGNGTVEVYNMDHIEKKLFLSREKLVAMSLLCGCDYDQLGVHGVGKENAFKYITSVKGDILQRLKALRSDETLIRLETERIGCSKCCHNGKMSEHRKAGCLGCGLEKGCSENTSPDCFKNLSEEFKKDVVLELAIRRKAIAEPHFPNEKTINEFLNFRQEHPIVIVTWQKPNVPKFCLYCQKMLEWELDYAFEKIFPLLTRWLLLFANINDNVDVVPEKLAKKRVTKGVPSFDVSWKVIDENLSGFLSLLTDECIAVSEGNCCTTEPLALVQAQMSSLYNEFMERTAKKPKSRKKAKKIIEKNSEAINRNTELPIESVLLDNLVGATAMYQTEPKSPGNSTDHSKTSYSLSPFTSSKIYLSSSVPEDIDVSVLFETDYGPFSCTNISAITNVETTRQEDSLQLHPNSYNKESSLNLSDMLEQLSIASNDSVSQDDLDATVDYDISAIVDGIISNRQYY